MQLTVRVIGAIDHAKHVIVDQSGQACSLKNVEAAVWAAERARASAEKALEEVNAHVATTKEKVRGAGR